MMNPSKADENFSDKTVNKVLHYANKDDKYSEVTILIIISIYESLAIKVKETRGKFIRKYGLKKHKTHLEKNFEIIKTTITNSSKDETDIFLATGNNLPHEGLLYMKKFYDEIIDSEEVISEKNIYAFKSVRNNSTNGKKLTVRGFTFHPSRQKDEQFFSDDNIFTISCSNYTNRFQNI